VNAQLIAAFEESLDIAPDPGDVLAGVRAGIRRRRRTRSAVAALAMVLLTGVALAWPAAPPRSDGVIPVGSWPTTFTVGWVPDGLTLLTVSSTAFQEARTYSSGSATLTIQVDNADRTPLTELPGWAAFEVAGRPGQEISRPTRTLIRFTFPSGRLVEVQYHQESGDGPDQAALRVGAERVSAALRETGADPVRARFAPTYLPKGQRIVGFDAQEPAANGEGAIIAVAGSLAPRPAEVSTESDGIVREQRSVDLGVGVTIQFLLNRKPTDYDELIAPIGGRPAYLTNKAVVVVSDFHGGWLEITPTVDGSSPPLLSADDIFRLLPPAELIKIAEGVRWVG
jgi:hypothetical protein